MSDGVFRTDDEWDLAAMVLRYLRDCNPPTLPDTETAEPPEVDLPRVAKVLGITEEDVVNLMEAGVLVPLSDTETAGEAG
jgi:hypothetical protein